MNYEIFLLLTLKFPKWPWVKVMTHPWVMGNLCVKWEPTKFIHKKDMDWTRIMKFFLPVTLNFPKWPWLNVMTNPWVMGNFCVKWEPIKFIHKKDVERTRIMKFFLKWPWTSSNELGSRSWHTLGSWAIFVWNENVSSLSRRKIWNGHELWNFSSSDLELAQMT